MEYMPNFRLHRPRTIADAVKLRGEHEESRYLSGGTDLIVNIRRGIEKPAHLIDVTSVDEMRAIKSDKDGLHIGGAVPLAELAADKTVLKSYAAISQAARAVAGSTHQKYGTIGGNLCLDTRCLYYNQSEWWRQANHYCFKKYGEVCHVAPGGQRCFAAFSGDVAPAMLVYGAEVELTGPKGTRRIPLTEMYKNDGRAHLQLEPGELLSTVHLPKPANGLKSAYEKARVRGSIDFPLAGAAVALALNSKGAVKDLRIALTAVNPYPQIVKGTDAYAGKPLDEAALDSIRENVRKQAKPMRTTTVAPWYRRRVVGALARRLVAELAGS